MLCMFGTRNELQIDFNCNIFRDHLQLAQKFRHGRTGGDFARLTIENNLHSSFDFRYKLPKRSPVGMSILRRLCEEGQELEHATSKHGSAPASNRDSG